LLFGQAIALSLSFLGRLDTLFVGLEHLILHVGTHVEDVRELNSRVQLLVLEGVHVEDDSLQVNDQGVRQFLHHGLLLDVHTVQAGITLVVVDGFTSDQSFKTVVDAILILNLKTQVEELFLAGIHISAAFADGDRACLAAKHILE
jgi:hypothetical protein